MKRIASFLVGSALVCSAPALAGEEPIYAPAGGWVDKATLPAETSGPPILLFDDQRLIEVGQLSSYIDRAIRIDNPQMLSAVGTLQAAWLPDKGDLIIHRIAIIRDGEEIDVLADGTKFEILRRERQLEQRMLDGSYTATLAVPGLRVGDILRLSYTVTLSDQALDEEVQAVAPLPSKPFEAQQARVRMSWPDGAPVEWRLTGGDVQPEVTRHDGLTSVEIGLPLDERDEMPVDAPVRYRMAPMLMAGTFDSWEEVSSIMAPLYSTEGTVKPGGAISQQVSAIEAAHDGKLERAVAALRLVQDEIAYLLNGMDGGNYIPQSPAETWAKRFGDCKAKTMLLLAMLREMGIEAEPVVVATQTGDVVPEMLPMPAAFDHVIVHAVIDGTDYWLDGTSSGASMAVVEEVPAFHVALPLREGGAALVEMAQRPQQAFDSVNRVTFDNRAGVDLPLLYDAEWTLSGPAAGPIRGLIGQASEEQLNKYITGFAANRLGENRVLSSELRFNEDSNTATVKVSGVMDSPWQWERGRASRLFSLPTAGFKFSPDRSRAIWRDIPVAIPGPYSERTEVTVLLPEDAGAYELEGAESIDEEIATVRLKREAGLADGELTIIDSAAYPGGELSPEAARQERSRAVRFGSAELRLRAPRDTLRRYDSADNRERFAPLEAAYTTLIEDDPDEIENYRMRARFRAATLDREGAIDDLDTVIEMEPGASVYLQRAQLLSEVGELEAALADAQAAWELYPSIDAAFAQANILPYLGRVDEAIALLEEQGGDAQERRTIATTISELEAWAGNKQQGLERIDEILATRPGDPEMLNAKCWYQATWNVQPDGLAEICTEAVEKADWSPPVLDSRAMGYYRLGRYQDALRDLDAALSASPDQSPSLFMRGIVRREMGDRKAGEADIRAALARQPSLERFFARFGIEAD
ncbi:tetratricopeptide (TPR) repeat protein/transglutaminase-like putative cysteine protease [Altererythrobacter atlanticus]|uniref:Tetratricopeptide repeat protein n=1 Tax=Croceibacterium atlanticum TaxID=1267766 RepID=A0A0F7KQ50_9SPHN|nr:DUF3857 domain-containing transglutaminase family protein [Croceibacterium atlanticum]AKH41262.1 Tetratricopeptide repeat protein [Croceibacterium atlanticum]MBB5732780.1 tetratricopeptide (TPR) repeat protein/transglutaminase-like putative cysteine protease [Croceibacterium atlanticum]